MPKAAAQTAVEPAATTKPRAPRTKAAAAAPAKTPQVRNPNGLDPVDVHIGKRIAQRRQHLGISQPRLSAMIGTKFQQVQKYEKAENRISGSKLYAVATALGVSVSYFYEGLPDPADPKHRAKVEAASPLVAFYQLPNSTALVDAYTAMTPEARKTLVKMASSAAALTT